MYDIKQGQVFENRNEMYEVVFQNDNIVLLQYGNDNHRLEDREYFGHCVKEGKFEAQQPMREIEQLQEQSDTSQDKSESVPFEEISWVGEKGAKSLRSSGIRTVADVHRTSDEKMLNCDSVGETAVENIREWIEENE